MKKKSIQFVVAGLVFFAGVSSQAEYKKYYKPHVMGAKQKQVATSVALTAQPLILANPTAFTASTDYIAGEWRIPKGWRDTGIRKSGKAVICRSDYAYSEKLVEGRESCIHYMGVRPCPSGFQYAGGGMEIGSSGQDICTNAQGDMKLKVACTKFNNNDGSYLSVAQGGEDKCYSFHDMLVVEKKQPTCTAGTTYPFNGDNIPSNYAVNNTSCLTEPALSCPTGFTLVKSGTSKFKVDGMSCAKKPEYR